MSAKLLCTACGHPADVLDWRCDDCGGPLDFVQLPAFDARQIDAGDFSLWRYAAMLPIERRVTFGEGMTPLVALELETGRVHAKLEYLNPTGSYKDRGTVTMMNHIAAQAVTEVVEDSSGNAGASVAAYSSAAGIRANIYVPATAAPAKIALIEAFGGHVIPVEGPQHAKTEACMAAAATTTYASHAWSPFFVLGQMTVAWEVWEQLARTAPDAIVTPLGHGGLFLGFARGFRALLAAGLIDRMPRLFAVQAANSDPIVRGWETNAESPPLIETQPTIADGIIVRDPVRGKEVLRAIREAGGAAVRVTESEIRTAHETLFRRGFSAEPTSAVTVAALPQIQPLLPHDARIVIALTGNDLKNVALR